MIKKFYVLFSGIGVLSGLVACVMWGHSRHIRNRNGGSSSAAASSFGINRLMDSSSSLNTTTISIVEEIGSNKSGEEEAGGNGTSKGHISVKDMNGGTGTEKCMSSQWCSHLSLLGNFSYRAVLFVIGHLSNCPIVHLSESGR